MAPIFIVVKTNGEIWVATSAPDALSIGGTVHKVTGLPAKQKICTANGTSSVTPTSKSGTQSDIS